MRERLASIAAVALVIVLVAVLGGLALRRVADRSEARRDGLPAAGDDEADRGPGPTDDIAIVGDSITADAESTFHAVLEPQYRIHVRGRGSYRIAEMEPYAIELSTGNPEQAVINLGTNDVLTNWPIDRSVTGIERMIEDFEQVRCLSIVTVNERMARESDPDLGARAMLFNLELKRLAMEHDLRVIDWAAAVQADAAAGSPDGDWLVDTVHPSPAGKAALARLYGEALADCR